MSEADGQLAAFEAGRRADFDLGVALDEYVAAQVKRTPSAIALSDVDERVTYAVMWRRVAALVAMLQERGVRRGDVVAVCAERSVDLPIVLLAIMRAGAAYCPLDASQPAQRLGHVIDLARPSMTLVAPSFEALVREAAEQSATEILVLGRGDSLEHVHVPGEPGESARATFDPRDPAYVIFTSGSTGRPKGVVVAHQGVVNRLLWMQDTFGLQGDDTVLQKTPYSFDVSVWELFWPLIAGARLHLAEPDGHRDPRYLAECVRSEQVTTMHFVPSMLSLFVEDPLGAQCDSLRRVIASGEALPGPLMLRALDVLAPATLWNLYGPTEASIDVTCWQCRVQPSTEPVPIGAPIANVHCYVLDESGQRVPVGSTGELCIGGVQVALGYVSQPELTAERFVSSALSPGPIYRTGDLACWRADGLLRYLGRCDRQVKLNGVRIELGEIEEVIRRMPEIVDVAVIVRSDVGATDRLVAYIVARESEVGERELRQRLSASLPQHMIPARIVQMGKLPTTPNGKLARDSLPAPTAR